MEDTRWAPPVQLAIAEDVGFGSPRKPSGLGPVCRKLSSNEAIKERDSPVRALVNLGRLRVDFHGLRLSRRGLSDRGGLEPKDGKGSGLGWISTGFGFCGFGFGDGFSPTVFGFRAPKPIGFGFGFGFSTRGYLMDI